MPSIEFNKTTKVIEVNTNYKASTEESLKKITEICALLFEDSSKFDGEKAFEVIMKYIKDYDRILYSQISNTVYACYNEHSPEDAANKLGTMISNIEKIMDYANTPKYKSKKLSIKQVADKKVYEDTEKALIKIWDHVSLAQTQYSGLKQTDGEYKKKFDNSIAPFKEELMKDMNAQLLTMVSIFTALAFLVFGGISSLGSIFSNYELPLLKVIIIGCVWGLCLLNIIFIFLFGIEKMTGLNFKSTLDPNANIVQKYPIVWWSDLIILAILSGTLWTYYIRSEHIDSWFIVLSRKYPQIFVIFGYFIIALLFILLFVFLFKMSRKK